MVVLEDGKHLRGPLAAGPVIEGKRNPVVGRRFAEWHEPRAASGEQRTSAWRQRVAGGTRAGRAGAHGVRRDPLDEQEHEQHHGAEAQQHPSGRRAGTADTAATEAVRRHGEARSAGGGGEGGGGGRGRKHGWRPGSPARGRASRPPARAERRSLDRFRTGAAAARRPAAWCRHRRGQRRNRRQGEKAQRSADKADHPQGRHHGDGARGELDPARASSGGVQEHGMLGRAGVHRGPDRRRVGQGRGRRGGGSVIEEHGTVRLAADATSSMSRLLIDTGRVDTSLKDLHGGSVRTRRRPCWAQRCPRSPRDPTGGAHPASPEAWVKASSASAARSSEGSELADDRAESR